MACNLRSLNLYLSAFKHVVKGVVVSLSFSRVELVSIRRRAVRRGVWFRVLSRVERGIVYLTIRCVDRVRSPTLAGVIGRVLAKLADAMRSGVERLMETVGRPLAARLSEFAQAWGHRDAWKWTCDVGFIRYLAVLRMNDSFYFG